MKHSLTAISVFLTTIYRNNLFQRRLTCAIGSTTSAIGSV